MSKQTTVLVDTNIWLDNYLGDRPGAASSRAFLDRAFGEGAVLCYAVTTAKDLFYMFDELPVFQHGFAEGAAFNNGI